MKFLLLFFGAIIAFGLLVYLIYWIFSKLFISKKKKPNIEKWWTILYYGHRGSGKTLQQAKDVLEIFDYLTIIYSPKKQKTKIKDNESILTPVPLPEQKKAIVYSVQRFNKDVEGKFLAKNHENNKALSPTEAPLLYYWNDAKELRYCPRVDCWKGKTKHRLHGAYLIFDDMATILPARNWQKTPVWMQKMFTQGRHFGIRVLSNCQDPFDCDVAFRRTVDMCFRFRKVISSPDPDETKPVVKRIWGIYVRRKIKAEWLWKFGDMAEDEIQAFKEKQKQINKVNGTNFFSDIWKATPHIINKKITSIYDTTQDVPEYKPTGYEHEELGCIDPRHDHEDKSAPNYCGFSKVQHNLV